MRRPSGPQRRLLTATLTLLVFAIAYYGGEIYHQRTQPAPAIAGVAIHPPAPVPELPDSPGAPLNPEALRGHWNLLMLDPHAGGIRSPALVRLLQIHNRLAADPERQRRLVYLYLPAQLDPATREAIDGLGGNIHALGGDPDPVAETFRRFGSDPDGEAATLYLIGPELRLHALFTPDEDIATIAKDLNTLITAEP